MQVPTDLRLALLRRAERNIDLSESKEVRWIPPEQLDELDAADDRSGAVKHFMRNAIGMPAMTGSSLACM